MNSDFRPGLSTQADMTVAYEFQIERAEELIKTLRRKVEDAKRVNNPDWGNVGDIQRLNYELSNMIPL